MNMFKIRLNKEQIEKDIMKNIIDAKIEFGKLTITFDKKIYSVKEGYVFNTVTESFKIYLSDIESEINIFINNNIAVALSNNGKNILNAIVYSY